METERARNQFVQIDEQLTQARAELATLLQLPPGELPEAVGELRKDAAYTLDELLNAVPRRRVLEAFHAGRTRRAAGWSWSALSAPIRTSRLASLPDGMARRICVKTSSA